MPGYVDMKLVSQDYYVLDNHSVEENIRDMLVGLSEDYKNKRSAKLLKLLELNPLKNLKAKNLSSGQKQRVAIARALALFPKLLLLDEPFSNLDKILKDKLFDFIIKEARKKHSGVILITHHAEEALKYSDRIGLIINGKIVQIGKKEHVYYKPKSLKIAHTLGDYNILNFDDFETASGFYKNKKKVLLRPNQFTYQSEKKGADLSVEYLNHFFNGKCYEVLSQTKSGKEMIFYASDVRDIKGKFFLRIS
jgi:ABC-type Fe3+/spermidine/putrescine transport system ATPase subunit